MSEQWRMVAVEFWRPQGEPVCRFVLVLDGPAGELRLDGIGVDEVLDYLAVQRLILSRLGILWGTDTIEGRTEGERAYLWKQALCGLLRHVPTIDPAAPNN